MLSCLRVLCQYVVGAQARLNVQCTGKVLHLPRLYVRHGVVVALHMPLHKQDAMTRGPQIVIDCGLRLLPRAPYGTRLDPCRKLWPTAVLVDIVIDRS